jgi:signal peptidase II
MIFFLSLILIDQISKFLVIKNNVNISLISKLLNITNVNNTGIVFGLFQGSNGLMIIISSVICLIISLTLLKYYKNKAFEANIIIMILAGGIGNLIDRIFRGYVVDFIDTPFIATFNFADSYIVIGVTLLIILEILPHGRNEKDRKVHSR